MPFRPTRVEINIPARYTYKDCEGTGTIVDISTGGIAMEVKQIFVPGDLLRVRFRIEEVSATEIDVWVIVCSVSGTTIGCKFDEISQENREKIDRFVTRLLQARGFAPMEEYHPE